MEMRNGRSHTVTNRFTQGLLGPSMEDNSIDRRFRLARIWSNRELAKIDHLFHGTVVNVSAGEDIDKEGRHYSDYFPNKSEYWMTNYAPGAHRGFTGRTNELLFDLTGDVPSELHSRFDVVFNHTTLEHVFEINKAFDNLCQVSRDIVIVVVPFCQVQHETSGYEDFWRISPKCLRKLFQRNGMEVIYEAANDDFNAAVYLFFVASRHPDRWKDQIPTWTPVHNAGRWVGQPSPADDNEAQIRTSGKWWNRLSSLMRGERRRRSA